MGLISPITIVYGRPFHRIPLWLIFITIITIVNGVYEPIYNYIIYIWFMVNISIMKANKHHWGGTTGKIIQLEGTSGWRIPI
jgi:hypothetical protein